MGIPLISRSIDPTALFAITDSAELNFRVTQVAAAALAYLSFPSPSNLVITAVVLIIAECIKMGSNQCFRLDMGPYESRYPHTSRFSGPPLIVRDTVEDHLYSPSPITTPKRISPDKTRLTSTPSSVDRRDRVGKGDSSAYPHRVRISLQPTSSDKRDAWQTLETTSRRGCKRKDGVKLSTSTLHTAVYDSDNEDRRDRVGQGDSSDSDDAVWGDVDPRSRRDPVGEGSGDEGF